ncbi:MAG: ABC-2 family transporter protein [Patescibacteria group bacterium]
MSKYWTLFQVALQDAFSERGSAVIWAFLDFLSPMMMLFIWLAIFQGQAEQGTTIGGFNLSQMLTYYFGVAFISAVATAHNEWDVARDIQSGELSMYLTRPLSYLGHQFITNISWKLLKAVCITPFLILTFYLFRQYLAFDFSPFQLLMFFSVLALSYLLYFFNSMVFGLIPFWLEEYGSFIELNEMVRSLFSGQAIPIIFLPGAFLAFGQFLPYRLFYDFPLTILSGRATSSDLITGVFSQLIWLAFFIVLFRFLWRKGIARYSAFGG